MSEAVARLWLLPLFGHSMACPPEAAASFTTTKGENRLCPERLSICTINTLLPTPELELEDEELELLDDELELVDELLLDEELELLELEELPLEEDELDELLELEELEELEELLLDEDDEVPPQPV